MSVAGRGRDMPLLTGIACWPDLQAHAARVAAMHLRDFFAQDADRARCFSRSSGDLWMDFSKQRLDQPVLDALLSLAEQVHMQDAITALFSDAHVNTTEDRPAGHWRLRLPETAPDSVVAQELARMEALVAKVQSGQWRGCRGDAITDVVNLGVGGSDLGPLMATSALDEVVPDAGRRPAVHFVSSMDGSQLSRLLAELDPARTLFVVASKSFTTVDTLTNAEAARAWLLAALGGDVGQLVRCHFIGVSASEERMAGWGIPAANQLRLWDWVGGRFSLWSAIGLAIAMRIGMPGFRRLLAGAHRMDCHFREAALENNLPVLAALVDIWNINLLDMRARAVLPYDARLKYLPAYLEQLEMESNGKSVSTDGRELPYQTCPVIWGEVGTNAQHAFYQLLHQGTQAVACEFLVTALQAAGHPEGDNGQQPMLSAANCLAQSHLLAFGVEEKQGSTDPHRRYRGNQVSTTLVLSGLNPETLGQLLAFYEHRVYAQSVLWHINPFDQWGVEQGKVIAADFLPLIGRGMEQDAIADSSTRLLARQISDDQLSD